MIKQEKQLKENQQLINQNYSADYILKELNFMENRGSSPSLKIWISSLLM